MADITTVNDYLEGHYTATSAELTRWNALADTDKAVYITNAEDAISAVKVVTTPSDDAILAAISETALALSDTAKTNDVAERKALAIQGISAVTMGGLSLSFTTGAALAYDLLTKALQALLPYINGGFETV